MVIGLGDVEDAGFMSNEEQLLNLRENGLKIPSSFGVDQMLSPSTASQTAS